MLQFCLLFLLGTVGAFTTGCSLQENYSECNADCDRYCNWANGTIIQPSCSDSCQKGCVCKAGYVRKFLGGTLCIPVSECKICPANEHYDLCSHHCQQNCRNKNLACVPMCHPGCICNEGYIRKEDSNSPCIPIEECPNELF